MPRYQNSSWRFPFLSWRPITYTNNVQIAATIIPTVLSQVTHPGGDCHQEPDAFFASPAVAALITDADAGAVAAITLDAAVFDAGAVDGFADNAGRLAKRARENIITGSGPPALLNMNLTFLF